MIRIIALLTMLLSFAATVHAADIGFNTAISQSAFKGLSKDAGLVTAYRVGLPPSALGITGFDAGIEVSAASIGDNWNSAFGNNTRPNYVVLPKLRARKGLPFGIDIGAMYSHASNTNIQLYGVELNKTFIDSNAMFPALGIRGSYTRTAGIDDLQLQTVGIDAAIGKGIFILTPYAGAGAVWVDSKAKGNLQRLATAANQPLSEVKVWLPRGFAGIELKPFPLFRVLGEVEYSVRPVYTLKATLGF